MGIKLCGCYGLVGDAMWLLGCWGLSYVVAMLLWVMLCACYAVVGDAMCLLCCCG